mgnify:CR=1 FL=1
MRLGHWILTIVFLLLFFYTASAHATLVFGTVTDAVTGVPLSGVELRSSDDRILSAVDGRFALTTDAESIIVRRPGYLPLQVEVESARQLQLQRFVPKALYLSFWSADVPSKRQQILRLIEATGLNALVIDIKSSRGHIAYRSKIPLASQIGAQRVRPLKDLPAFLAELKQRGIYTIARMVVFKDDLLAKQRPEFAAHTQDGQIWQDREKLSWSDPFNQQVRDYNLDVAEEAAQLGFDEVQFDYVRFPSKSDLIFSQETDDESRVAAINRFLSQAKERLAPYPVFTSANIFGYICWKHRDGKIGQRLVELGEQVDYLSPMLYPSGFPRGIPGYANPVKHPYEVIAVSLQKAQKLGKLAPERFRPWLQAFRDYAFDRRSFKAAEVHAQINASDAVGSNGWMLWNAASRFSLAGLQHEVPWMAKKLVDIEPKSVEPAMLTRLEMAEDTKPL